MHLHLSLNVQNRINYYNIKLWILSEPKEIYFLNLSLYIFGANRKINTHYMAKKHRGGIESVCVLCMYWMGWYLEIDDISMLIGLWREAPLDRIVAHIMVGENNLKCSGFWLLLLFDEDTIKDMQLQYRKKHYQETSHLTPRP